MRWQCQNSALQTPERIAISQFKDTAWAEIDLAALRHNATVVRQLAPRARIMAMLKADAYGHGLMACARALHDQVDALAVARLDEAEKLRQLYPDLPMLLTAASLDADSLAWCASRQVSIVLHEESVWRLLGGLAQLPPIWLKLNTGMNRLGFAPERFLQVLSDLHARGLRPVVMSHFSCADEPGSPATTEQIACFDTTLAQAPDCAQSLANSAAIIAWPQAHRAWVRPGIMLYGVNPVSGSKDLGLRPVMSLKARVLGVHDVPAGATVGYGQRWQAAQPARIATVGMGYGDGYPRVEHAQLQLSIGGQRAPLTGRVSMDMLAADVSQLDGVCAGDEVELWGRHVSVEEVAGQIGSISYDLLCRVQSRVRHRYLGLD